MNTRNDETPKQPKSRVADIKLTSRSSIPFYGCYECTIFGKGTVTQQGDKATVQFNLDQPSKDNGRLCVITRMSGTAELDQIEKSKNTARLNATVVTDVKTIQVTQSAPYKKTKTDDTVSVCSQFSAYGSDFVLNADMSRRPGNNY